MCRGVGLGDVIVPKFLERLLNRIKVGIYKQKAMGSN